MLSRSTCVFVFMSRNLLVQLDLSQIWCHMCSAPTKCRYRFVLVRLQCYASTWTNTFYYKDDNNKNIYYKSSCVFCFWNSGIHQRHKKSHSTMLYLTLKTYGHQLYSQLYWRHFFLFIQMYSHYSFISLIAFPCPPTFRMLQDLIVVSRTNEQVYTKLAITSRSVPVMMTRSLPLYLCIPHLQNVAQLWAEFLWYVEN